MCTEVYVPGFAPQARIKDLKQMENPRFKSFDEYLWFYFPKGSEQTFFRHGDPGEIARYLVDRALTTRTKEQFAEWLRKFQWKQETNGQFCPECARRFGR